MVNTFTRWVKPIGIVGLKRLLCVGLLFAAAVPSATSAEPVATGFTGEYQAKANFLLNFARYVKWPVDGNDVAPDTLNFCLAGASPLEPALAQFIAGKRIQNRTPNNMRLTGIDQINGCHALFISQAEQNFVPKLAETLGNASALTVAG